MRPDKKVITALFLHSLFIISMQVVLMRILSIMQWDHFANMIIGIAMLGFGVSGTWLAIRGKHILPFGQWLIPLLMILSSVFSLLAYRLSQHPALVFDTFLVFGSTKQALRLVLFILLFFLPFLTASLAIGIIYVQQVSDIGKLYFSNLLGSGIGGGIGLFCLALFLPSTAFVITILFPVLAALVIFPKQRRKLITTALLIFIFIYGFNLMKPVDPTLSQYKSLSKTLQLPDAVVTLNQSGIASSVQVVESAYLRYAPGLSLHFTGEIPVKPALFTNGDFAGFIPTHPFDTVSDILDHTGFKLPYLFSDYDNMVIVGSGTGTLVAQALRKGANHVHALEPNFSLIGALEKWHRCKTPSVYSHPKVKLHHIEARSFFNTTDETFNLIVLPNIGSFGAVSGLQAIREDFTITAQALDSYWDKLDENGSLAITVYDVFPPRPALKLVASFVDLLRNNGIEYPKNHLAAIRSWTSITFVVSKQPITDETSNIIRDFCTEMGFDPFLLPDIENDERYYFNYIENKELFTLTDQMLGEPDRQLHSDYLFYITPATDNQPYFSRFLKISRLTRLLQTYGKYELPFIELGYLMVWLTFLVVLVLSGLFILIPVLAIKLGDGKFLVFLYFCAIGLGFMFVEIILIQRFILFLGQPVYAVSAVLSIMLVSSGIGSYCTSKIEVSALKNRMIFFIVSGLLAIYALLLTPFLSYTSGSSFIPKILITILIVGLPAFFMGMPFPLGMKLLSEQHSNKVAWGWGINGFASVVATPLALIIAIEGSSQYVLVLGSLFYILSLFGFLLIRKKYG